jgi:hypothetical protein
MEAPKKEVVHKYLQCDTFCPWCEQANIEILGTELDTGVVWQECACKSCNAKWTDEYRIVAISWKDGEIRHYSDEHFEGEVTK